MSVATRSFFSAEPADPRRTATTFAISRALFRQVLPFDAAISTAARALLQTGTVEGACFEIETANGNKSHHVFGDTDPGLEVVFGESTNQYGVVRVWFTKRGIERPDFLQCTAVFTAQQVALRWAADALRSENELLRVELRMEREGLALRKMMDRAKAVIARRSHLNTRQAEEFLVGTSVRTGRPLLHVANEMVLAYGASANSFRWRRKNDRRSRRTAA